MRQHYPSLLSHVTIKMVPCPSICTDALGILSSLSPYSFDASPSADIPNIADVPIGAIPLLSVSSPEFQDTVNKTVVAANIVYQEFLKSEEGHGFSGQVVMLGDSMGSLLAYEALCRGSSNDGGSRSSRTTDDDERFDDSDMDAKRLLVAPSPRRRRSSSSSDSKNSKLEFEVSDFFMFGSPLSIVLAAKKLHDSKTGVSPVIRLRKSCINQYFLFYSIAATQLPSSLQFIPSNRSDSFPSGTFAKRKIFNVGSSQCTTICQIPPGKWTTIAFM